MAAPSWQVLTDFIGQRQEVQGHLVDIETLVIKRHCYRMPPQNGNGNVYEEGIPIFVKHSTAHCVH